MSTHTATCIVCGTTTCCTSDEHCLGVGGGCESGALEFCSLRCFMQLREQMEQRLVIAKELYPEWFKEAE